MIKEMLENYMDYIADIKTKQNELKKIELERENPSVSSPNYEINGDIRPQGFVSSKLEKESIKNIDKERILLKEIDELQSRIEMLNSLINTLSDYHRQLIELRYKYNKKDIQIATIVFRGKKAVNKQINKAIGLLEEKYKKFLKSS